MVLGPSEKAPFRFSAERIFAAIACLFFFGIVLLAFVHGLDSVEPSYKTIFIVALLPVFAYLAFRYPIVFPFGLYVALVPFDALLQSSGGATLVRFVAIATAGAMIFHALLLRRAFAPSRGWWFWAGFVLYTTISLFWTIDLKTGMQIDSTVIQLFLFMTVLAIYPATKAEFKTAMAFVIACGMIASGYAIQQFLSGKISADTGARVDLSSGNVSIDPNYFAATFILPVALAMCFTFYGKTLYVRLVSAASTLVLMAGLFVTGSRGGFIAACALFVYFAIRSKYKLQIFGLLAFVGAVSLCFPSVYERFVDDPSGQQGSASGRTFIWQTGLYSLKDHFFFGNGIGSYVATYDSNLIHVYQAAFQGWSRPSHSILVGSITELGIVGLIVFLAAWYVSFRQMKVIPKTSEWYGFRIAFEGCIVGLFAMSLSIDPTYIKFIWFAHAMVLMLLNQADPHVLRPWRRPAPLVMRRPAYVLDAPE